MVTKRPNPNDDQKSDDDRFTESTDFGECYDSIEIEVSNTRSPLPNPHREDDTQKDKEE